MLKKLTTPEPPSRLTPAYQWIILSILWFSHIVYFLNYLTVGTLAPLIQPELRLSSARIGFLCSAITIGSMATQIPAGILCDLIGVKWVMSLGLVVMGGASISMSWVHSYTSAFLLLMLLGLGIGCIQAPASKAIMTWFSPKGRATAMGIKQTGINIGGVLASILLPALALQFNSWRFSFRTAGFASLFSALLVFTFYKETYVSSGDSFRMPFLKKSFLYLLSQRDFSLICLSGVFLMMTQYSFTTYFMLYANRVLNIPIHHSGSSLGSGIRRGCFRKNRLESLKRLFIGRKKKPHSHLDWNRSLPHLSSLHPAEFLSFKGVVISPGDTFWIDRNWLECNLFDDGWRNFRKGIDGNRNGDFFPLFKPGSGRRSPTLWILDRCNRENTTSHGFLLVSVWRWWLF